jgi:hypothetical protein
VKIILWVLGIRNPEFEALADKPFVSMLLGALPQTLSASWNCRK